MTFLVLASQKETGICDGVEALEKSSSSAGREGGREGGERRQAALSNPGPICERAGPATELFCNLHNWTK